MVVGHGLDVGFGREDRRFARAVDGVENVACGVEAELTEPREGCFGGCRVLGGVRGLEMRMAHAAGILQRHCDLEWRADARIAPGGRGRGRMSLREAAGGRGAPRHAAGGPWPTARS